MTIPRYNARMLWKVGNLAERVVSADTERERAVLLECWLPGGLEGDGGAASEWTSAGAGRRQLQLPAAAATARPQHKQTCCRARTLALLLCCYVAMFLFLLCCYVAYSSQTIHHLYLTWLLLLSDKSVLVFWRLLLARFQSIAQFWTMAYNKTYENFWFVWTYMSC